KVAVGAQAPQDATVSGAIGVVDFDNPVLISHREQKIAVIRRIHEGVAVRPVVSALRRTGDVEMIKGIPCPDSGALLGIPVDNDVTGDRGLPGNVRAGDVGEEDVVAIGELEDVVMKAGQRRIGKADGVQTRLKLDAWQSENGVTGEIHLANLVGVHDQEVSVRQRLDRERREDLGGIKPNDIALQVRDHGSQQVRSVEL